ncbi:MAG: CcmD family protein [Sandaracinaceae bacterium]|nr:CcmD family protein [Sandaracinaceae bacterium]
MRPLHAIVLAFAVLSACPVALAQEDAAESRAATFEAARGAQLEEIPGGGLLVAAYGVVFLLVLLYVVSIGFRQARTARELDRLEKDMKAHARSAASGNLPPEEF